MGDRLGVSKFFFVPGVFYFVRSGIYPLGLWQISCEQN